MDLAIGYNDHIVAKLIKEDEIDILVELSGHSAFNRLKTVALEPAPITIKWWVAYLIPLDYKVSTIY